MKSGNKKSKKQLKNFLSRDESNKSVLKFKRKVLAGYHLDAPIFSWPTDKETLLQLISDYLNRVAEYKENGEVEEEDVSSKFIPVLDANDEKPATENVETEGSAEGEETETTEEVRPEPVPMVDTEPEVPESEYIDLPEQLNDVHNCSAKALGNIVRLLNYRSKTLRKIKLMRRARMSGAQINREIQKVVLYNLVLGKYTPILNNQEIIDNVTLATANKLFDDVCVEGYDEIPTQAGIEGEIKKNKEDQDFDIVAALNYVGVTVDRDDFGFYSVKDYNNGNGIKYYIGSKEKSFALSKDGVNKFVEQFLNKPIEKRKFLTPGQVFIAYISEAEKSLGISTHSASELENLFGRMNSTRSAKSYFKEVIKKYSRNAAEWKDFQKLFYGEYYANKESKDDTANKIHIKQQAKRLVIGDIFEEFINNAEILSTKQLDISDYRASDISRDFGLDMDIDDIGVNKTRVERVEDQAFRIINTMHSTILELRGFVQDIIDNYTVDYLRKEKIFLMQQDEQSEIIRKKKEYEDLIDKLSYDKAKDSNQEMAYYRTQVDELTQKIGDKEYRDSKNDLLKSKNTYRILLLNAKAQKDAVKIAIKEAESKALSLGKLLTIEEKIDIVRDVLSNAPELVVTFERGKATTWTKRKVGERAEKREEKLTEIDKSIEMTAARISDESHQKIMEENAIREKIKKSEKEDRVKSVNAYINAYGSIVGNATGIGGYAGMPVNNSYLGAVPPSYVPPVAPQPYVKGMPRNTLPEQPIIIQTAPAQTVASTPAPAPAAPAQPSRVAPTPAPAPVNQANSNAGTQNGAPVAPVQNTVPIQPAQAMAMGGYPYMPSGGGYMPAGDMTPHMSSNQPALKDYQNFDYVSDNIEPCVIPFVVGYDSKGATIYGNMLETYATMDRYKFLLNTNNNALYTYIDDKRNKIQTPEQIISDLHIRYVKNAMAKSGLGTLDSNLAKFDYKADLRKFLSQYVPQNLIDIVISDYNELIASCDFELLKDLIEHKFSGDLENYIPDNIKQSVTTCAQLIATIVKSIMSDPNIKKTFEAYSSKMKQTYINSLIDKIDSNAIPTVKLSDEEIYSRMLDYLSFSIKAQNVIIQTEDGKDNGFGTYPRSIFFAHKNNADTALKMGKTLTYEQNDVVTTRNNPTLDDSNVVNLFGPLYKYNGGYGKLLIKLKPYNLAGGVKFAENMIDALREKIDIKATVLNDNQAKPTVPLVKFSKKNKEKKENTEDATYEYEDDKWFVRRGFVVNKEKVDEYYYLVSFGLKYALDRNKTELKKDFYTDKGLLSLNKIGEVFKDLPEDKINVITSVIRNVMMINTERFIDYLDEINKQVFTNINKMIYIAKMTIESGNFDTKNKDEKLETIDALDLDFTTKADDIKAPHPEIYATTEDMELYNKLYLYYALNELFTKSPNDKRFITEDLETYFEDYKRKLRNALLAKIRDHKYMNGYEVDIAKYFELNVDNVVDTEARVVNEETQEEVIRERVNIKNIDVIFKGILDGFKKAVKDEKNTAIVEQMQDVSDILEFVGTLPAVDKDDKDLEIALPNNQVIQCNIKGFIQQYLFRFIVDREHELGPFAYVVGELAQHEEFGEIVKNLEIVANKLNSNELGINLIASFSSITLSNNGNVFKIGDNITTALETINRLKTPTDMQKALNRDVFYKDGVNAVAECFGLYFNRLKLESME